MRNSLDGTIDRETTKSKLLDQTSDDNGCRQPLYRPKEDMMKLKKSTTTTGSRVRRTVAQKIEVIRLITNDGVKGADALEQVFGDTTTDAMRNHPHSIVAGYRTAIQKLIDKGDAETIALLQQAELVDDDSNDADDEDAHDQADAIAE